MRSLTTAARSLTYYAFAQSDRCRLGDRAAALRLHAAARGLELDAAAAEFLLKRVARDMTALTQWLARLDRASLSAQRRLTIPFIREQLGAE